MRGRLLIITILVALGVAGCNNTPKHIADKPLIRKEYKVVVEKGDTLDGISARYFDRNGDGRTWQEFRYDTYARNHYLFGGGRSLQPNDVVTVVIRE